MPSFAEVQRALRQCMAVEMPIDGVLSTDASTLGTLFAEMMYLQQDHRPADALSDQQQACFARWSTSSAA
ncbi:hypothetical protein [Chitinimonas koreensis]|uniref:hypothetical protein n=1 Tax=Chitinimonas koreensis TaxID=356302 RepID=UPI0003FCD006|nr:hypothetical protein [Chitinimonas koreensis]